MRLRWRGGIPLRDTVVLVMVIGVTTPALLLLTVEQQLAQKSQQALITQSELSLMSIGSVSIAEPMWVVDRNALNAAAGRLLENPQVVAVRIAELLATAPVVERVRSGYSLPLGSGNTCAAAARAQSARDAGRGNTRDHHALV